MSPLAIFILFDKMKFNWDKYRMLVKNNPKRAEEYIKECQKRDTVLEIEAPQEETAIE